MNSETRQRALDPRSFRIGVLVLGALAALVPCAVRASVIVRKPGGTNTAQMTRALTRALGPAGSTRVVELTGDLLADSAQLAREAGDEPVVFAIGPHATEAAGEAAGPAVVSLGVPNPARIKTPGVYVSIYPRLELVFEYLKGTLGARRVGLLFTPAQNREVALSFLKAGEAEGVSVVPIPVRSSANLVRQLKKALPEVDTLLLAVDPILFDRRSLEYVIRESRAANKPTVGFLEELTRLGVTVSLVAPVRAAAAAAVEASQEMVRVGKKRVDVDESVVVVSKESARAMGLNPEAMGAQKTH